MREGRKPFPIRNRRVRSLAKFAGLCRAIRYAGNRGNIAAGWLAVRHVLSPFLSIQ